MADGRWTNPSVRALASGEDPIETVTRRARESVYRAREKGWAGPPFDPFELADRLGVEVVAVEGIADARLVHVGRRPRIEFNPNRPLARIRFSIAHELGHLLFPDAAEQVRHRAHESRTRGDEWQVELLCNLAAAEFLMPVGSFPNLEGEHLEINRLMRLRAKYEVSTEALVLHMIHLTPEPAAAFAAARVEGEELRFRIDYSVAGRAWTPRLRRGALVQARPLAECTAVGHTAKGEVRWDDRVQLQCVGVPPYPGQRYPRVVGFIRPHTRANRAPGISYVDGDASAPRGEGPRIIAHIVNDKTVNWGGAGFASHLRRAYPEAQEQFREWGDRRGLALGESHLAELSGDVYVFSMVAQHGYGPSPRMRLRYGALEGCLDDLGQVASEKDASVHMPLIGTGQAGGDWGTVKELIYRSLSDRLIEITVYLRPGAPLPDEAESQLTLST